MSRHRTLALIGVLLATVAIVGAAAPVAAHPGGPIAPPAAPPLDTAAMPAVAAAVTLGAPGFSPLLVAGALLILAAAAAARRRPRAALVVALALLLTIFAFETALHSVHHGLDPKQSNECAIAAASAQLAAVTVDTVIESSVILAVAGRATEPGRSPAPIRLVGPDQDRAPPVPTA
jgi:fumarate reductase subunit D